MTGVVWNGKAYSILKEVVEVSECVFRLYNEWLVERSRWTSQCIVLPENSGTNSPTLEDGWAGLPKPKKNPWLTIPAITCASSEAHPEHSTLVPSSLTRTLFILFIHYLLKDAYLRLREHKANLKKQQEFKQQNKVKQEQ